MRNCKTDDLHPLGWDDLRYFLAVARAKTASHAAKQLNVNYTTVARRIRGLEAALGVLLFEKSRAAGFVLTAEGERLLPEVDALESRIIAAQASFLSGQQALTGTIRVACTEAFGCSVLAPKLPEFQRAHPQLDLELLPLPHFVSLSKREADVLISLERPEQGAYVVAKLTDYHLCLYATPGFLAEHGPLEPDNLAHLPFVNYVTNLAFSPELLYLDGLVPSANPQFRSTSIIAQTAYVQSGQALGVLPCFYADSVPGLIRVFPEQHRVQRSFWVCCREDLWGLQRIKTFWQFLRQLAEQERQRLLITP